MSIHNQSYEDLIREKRAFLLVEALKRKGVDANVDYYLKKSIEELDHLALEHGIDLEDRQEAPTTTVLTNDPSPVQSPSPPSPVPRQWCWDWYNDYTAAPSRDPYGPASGSDRVLRGGSWYLNPQRCRASNRNYIRPTDRLIFIGFRLAGSF